MTAELSSIVDILMRFVKTTVRSDIVEKNKNEK